MRGDITLFLGLVVVVGGGIVLAVFVVFGGADGGGGGSCDRALPPLGGGQADVSQLGFQEEDVGLGNVIGLASAGSLDAAESAFFGDVHNFTHNVDPSLREVDEQLAKDLCEAVVEIEEELVTDRSPAAIAGQAMRIQELLRDAAEALGFARPGG